MLVSDWRNVVCLLLLIVRQQRAEDMFCLNQICHELFYRQFFAEFH